MSDVIILLAQYAIALVPILYMIALIKYVQLPYKKRFVVYTALGLTVGYGLLLLAHKLYFDPRPFTRPGIVPLFKHSADNGFPSDHTTVSAVVAFLVLPYAKRLGFCMLSLAAVIGTARVLAHVHSWIDIVGAFVVGAMAAGIAYGIVWFFTPPRIHAR